MRCANLEFRGRNLLEGGVCSDIYLTSSDHANSTQNNHITVKAFASSRQTFIQEIPQADRSLTKIADFGPEGIPHIFELDQV